MKYIISLLVLFVVCSSNAQSVPYNGIFWNDSLQINFEGDKFKTDVNQSAGHLGIHGHDVLRVFQDNPYLAYPFFDVGVIDNGIYLDHEDFHDFVMPVNTSFSTMYHGTGVSSLFSTSGMANNLGTHGLVNGRTFFNDYTLDEDNYILKYLNFFNNSNTNIKIITQSMALEADSSYAKYEGRGNEGNSWPVLVDEFSADEEIARVQAVAPLRKYFLENPDTLFILAAGNSSQNALKNNGAVHYKYESMNFDVVYSEIPNVIVVGAVGFYNTLHHYSDFGLSVDIAGISGLYAARCVDNGQSYYYFDNEENSYGIFMNSNDFSEPTIADGKSECNVDAHTNATMNGTSASAPVIAGLAAVLQNMDNSLSPAQIKDYLTDNTSKYADTRYIDKICESITEECNIVESLQNLENLESNVIGNNGSAAKSEIPIPNLFDAYNQLKIDIEIQVDNDISSLVNLTREVNDDTSCENLWNDGTSTRKVIGPKKSYEAKFYGDRCLYFRGNSFIIDYDLETKTASKLYYDTVSNSKYREYMTFRHFVNNLKSAKSDETWRNGYGVTLNSYGNVGCTIADNCTNGRIRTALQCENMFTALTGVDISTFEFEASYNDSVCKYENFIEFKAIHYNMYNEKIKFYLNIDLLDNFKTAVRSITESEHYNYGVNECKNLLNSINFDSYYQNYIVLKTNSFNALCEVTIVETGEYYEFGFIYNILDDIWAPDHILNYCDGNNSCSDILWN